VDPQLETFAKENIASFWELDFMPLILHLEISRSNTLYQLAFPERNMGPAS